MASRITVFLCVLLVSEVFHCLPIGTQQDAKIAAPLFFNLCAWAQNGRLSQKILCLFCKGFDPSCWIGTTTPIATLSNSTTPPPSSSTSIPTTSTQPTSTSSSTTTTTTTPSGETTTEG